MNMTSRFDAFKAWWDNGFRDLIPVIPPDAKISPTSYIAKNDGAGKAPGVMYNSGLWGGMPGWREHQTTEQDLASWFVMGASVGLRRGAAFMLDIDAYDADVADMIEQAAIEMLGPAPIRVGQWPKRALLYKADGPISGLKVTFEGPGAKPSQIEVPAQTVIYGVHKKTGKPYDWPRKPVGIDKLSVVSADKLNAFMEHMRRKLPKAQRSDVASSSDRDKIDQRKLMGDPDLVAAAVRRLPNTQEAFPTYDDMIRVLNAISAALPAHRDLANELAHDWCSRWEGGDYDHDLTERRIATVKPPHSFGAAFLYKEADRLNPMPDGKSFVAMSIFEALPDPEIDLNLFNTQEPEKPKDTFRLLTIDEILHRPKPTWLIERHIPDKAVGFMYSEPGAGKSFLALDMALSIAHNLDNWQGDSLKQQDDAVVVYIAAEGAFDFGTRVKAWHKARHIENLSKRFYIIEQTINFMKPEDVDKLLRTLKTVEPLRPALVVVDTVSRALPGADENLQKDMTRFVQACDAVRDTFDCAVLGIHHAGKSGDMRGSTVLLGAGDFVFRLQRKKGATIGNLFCEKQKAAPDGWEEPYRFDLVVVGEGETSLVPSRADMSVGPSVELTPDTSARVLAAMRAAWDEGEPWSKAPQAKERYAVRRMVTDFGFDGVKAEETLKIWEASGLISVEMKSSKHRISGFKVGEGVGHSVQMDGIFG
jgi:hypothetical protein